MQGVNSQTSNPASISADPAAPAGPPARLDREAFQALYLRNWSAVFNYFRFRIGPLEAEDAASELFTQLWSRRASFDPQRAPAEHWMWASVRNAAIDALRRRGPAPETLDGLAVQASLEERTTQSVDLLARLHRLGDGDREILALRFGAGLTHQHIAKLLGLRAGTVAVRVHRALHRLRAMETASEEGSR